MKYIKPNPSEVIYFSQRNNSLYPMRACFATSLAMALRNNGLEYEPINGLAFDDYIMQLTNGNEGKQWAKELGINPNTPFLNEWWSLMERCANELLKRYNVPLKCKWTAIGNRINIVQQVNAGLMPVVGTMLSNRGHIVTVSGYTDKSIILCDPYGNPNTGYKDFNGYNVELWQTLIPKIMRYMLLFG